MRRGASGARRICVYLRMGRGRYQNSPTAVPRSSLTPDWKGEPHADDFYIIAPAHEGHVLQRSRVCEDRVPAPTTSAPFHQALWAARATATLREGSAPGSTAQGGYPTSQASRVEARRVSARPRAAATACRRATHRPLARPGHRRAGRAMITSCMSRS